MPGYYEQEHKCQVCNQTSNDCKCVCPVCQHATFDDVTITDHNKCYDCHKTELEEVQP